LIRLESIAKTFVQKEQAIEALVDIDMEIAAGSIYGIIGRSGAGKSTLIRLFNLLEQPTAGSIVINGREITRLKGVALRRMRHSMGMIFQHFNLLWSRTVLDNVCLPLRLVGVPRRQRRARARQLLAMVGLEDYARSYPAQLSGGQKQRVGIARALANEPEILLCDEATSALDPETTQSILELLADINQRLGITIVMITHSMDVIRAVCDEVAVLDQGRLIEQGPVIDVFLHPQHAVTQSLLLESSGSIDAEAWKAFAADTRQRIVRLSYRGETTAQPLISQASKSLDADISILQGTVSKLKNIAYGQLIIAIHADASRYEAIETFFRTNNVDYEVLQP